MPGTDAADGDGRDNDPFEFVADNGATSQEVQWGCVALDQNRSALALTFHQVDAEIQVPAVLISLR